MAESKLSRTTVSMEGSLYEQAMERWQKLGYGSFSEYVQFLLESDLSERRPHVTVRNEETGAKHSKQDAPEKARKPKSK